MYDPDLQKLREHEKELKKRRGKLPAKAEKVHKVIGGLFYTNWGSDFAKFLKMIVKNSDERKIKKTERILDDMDKPPSWGPQYRSIWYDAPTATDAVKGTLFMRILPAILYEKLNMPIDVATRLIQKHLAGGLVQKINHVMPTHEHKDKVIEILKDAVEEENIKLSEEEIEKIAELATEIGEMLHEGLPDTDDVHVRMFAAFKEKRTWEVGRILLENFPELREAIEKHSDRITRLADELAEMRREKEAKENAIKSGKVYDDIFARLDRLETKIDKLTRKMDELVELIRLLSEEG